MTTSRTAAGLVAGVIAAGALIAPALSTPSAHAAAPASSVRATVQKASGPQWPWMSVALTHSVKGRTLTYRYSDVGWQYQAHDANARRSFAPKGSAGYQILFGDGQQTGGNGLGGASCKHSGSVQKFSDRTPNLTHRYAKPGKYKVTVRGWYCGAGRANVTQQSYWVSVR